MKHRVTYLLHEGEPGVDPASLEVEEDRLEVPELRAAREWRTTLGLNELPEEVCISYVYSMIEVYP